MCGIVAVVSRPPTRPVPDGGEVLAELAAVNAAVAAAAPALAADPPVLEPLAAAAARLESVDALLRGAPGLACLLAPPAGGHRDAEADLPHLRTADQVAGIMEELAGVLDGVERSLDAGQVTLRPEALEAVNAVLVRLRDGWWAVSKDRVGAARAVAELAPSGLDLSGAHPAALDALWSINVALASIDRLEVRGRDSAGVHVLITDHGLDLHREVERSLLGARANDALFTSLAARTPGGALSLVYKAAAEIGELGDNVAALRAAVRSDALLARALHAPTARTVVLGHTRWASVGVISQANAHPLNSEELGRPAGPYVTAALNGDVDNHAELRLSEALRVPDEITTDAKVIPALVSRRLAEGVAMDEAWRQTVARFDGSVAIAASAADDPDRLHLALRGSGQSLYVGLAPDAFVVASEPYGLVEETASYVRMDGEATQGQVMVLDRSGAGTLGGLTRRRYDGGDLPLEPHDVAVAQITTRDIDRGGFPHFLLKEISEAPASFRKTLRGKVLAGPDGRLRAVLGPDALPADLVAAVADNRLRRVLVVGQGTAAVAGRAVAAAFTHCLPELATSAVLATELSGFGLSDEMADTLVIAVSQSGTTTDTNRTVDLVRARGAHVVAVVNRRNSDLATKAHGTLYTSDGRDVEMSVASTKAFYAQVAAGWLLALGLADAAGRADAEESDRLLRALRELPDAMEEVLAGRESVGRIAAAVAPPRRYWAVVGSGPDTVAAAEVRIKLSELCYRSIACDATEDKKHIDLSCEPLILVCAAGLSGPNADDVAKEVAIYRAHQALPVVIASAGEADRFAHAREVITVPACEPVLAFVLSAMVGHLFGYEAALAIDAQARPLRAARAAIEAGTGVPADDLLRHVGPAVGQAAAPFVAGLRSGAYNGNLEASTAVRVASLLRYVTGVVPVEGYELETGKVGSPGVIVADLFEALSDAVDELTRPVDAIKHQAKTVTVGISRSEDALLALPLVKETLAAGASSDALGYRALRTLGHLDPAVLEVLGYTRYRVEWPAAGAAAGGWPTATVIDQGGVARRLRSRTETDPRLLGTKHRAAEEREVSVARGASDGRTVVIVPEVKANLVTGMTLLHVRLAPTLPAAAVRAVLSGYRGRYAALRDAVTETETSFDDALLAEVPLVDLLTEPVYVLARRWRSGAGAATTGAGIGAPGDGGAA
jgi:glucosamine--fructose-6-phosphate aminotransferase (isomerizing)